MNKIQHIHFVGIGGIGMSGIAKIAKKQGYVVSGCDLSQNKNTNDLKNLDCSIAQQHQSPICKDDTIDLIVHTSDIPLDHPEILHAKKHNIPAIKRSTMLAKLMHEKLSIGVAGSHGKTTTSSMLSHILLTVNLDPTIIIGGNLHTISSNAHHGKGNILVAEADESDRSLLELPVQYAILTNIDFEHPNEYQDIQDVTATFKQYLKQIPQDGHAIIYADDPIIQSIIPSLSSSVTTYGQHDQADFVIHNISLEANASTFTITKQSTQQSTSVTVSLPGIHNVLNATAAITAAHISGVSLQQAAQSIATFHGVDRRFTFKGLTKNNVEIFDDYGHHPTEIDHTIKTAHNRKQNNLVVVFQPQRYTRTQHLWKEFIQSFQTNKADHLIITDIYAASEPEVQNINSKRLVEEIKKSLPGQSVYYCSNKKEFEEIKQLLPQILQPHDLLLFLGAGKVNQLIDTFI